MRAAITFRRARPWLIAAVAAYTSVAGTACGGDAVQPVTRAQESSDVTRPLPDANSVPPNNQTAIAGVYDRILQPHGYFISRASVENDNGDYTAAGDVLALYVSPLNKLTADDYAQGLWDITALLVPDALTRWPGIRAIDLCQEPPANRTAPQPEESGAITQLFIERAAANQIDWNGGNLDDLLASARTSDGITLNLNTPATESPLLHGYLEAVGADAPR